MGIGQPVGQIAGLGVNLPGRAGGRAQLVAGRQIQHAIARRGAFKLRHAALPGHLHPLGHALPAVPARIQAQTDARRRNPRQRAAGFQLGTHGVAKQGHAPMAAQALADLAFEAGETRIGLAVLQQLQAIVLV
ncbi:hypothetical protein D3C78_1572480 [compost metagenome]